MNTTIKFFIIFLALFLSSCTSNKEQQNKKNEATSFFNKDIRYYANKTLSSLKIPPDLTNPDYQDAFRLSEYVTNIKEDVISFSDETNVGAGAEILKIPSNIVVKKDGARRWLIVDKKPDVVWNAAIDFLRSNSFIIKKSNKKTGLIETDFLENQVEIPSQSLGLIRSTIKKALNVKYNLPVVDKYRISVEPIEAGNKSQVYLSLISMKEVIDTSKSNKSTVWQSNPKDQVLETHMLYRFMLFLGEDSIIAQEKVINAKDDEKIKILLSKNVSGYAKLTFPLNRYDTWRNVGWALNQLDADIDDKDIKESSFYINAVETKSKGLISRLFGKNVATKSFQIIVREIKSDKTEVYFNDLAEENDKATIDFSYKLFEDIAKQFE